ncbi:MAG: hypothetical protein HUJ75_07950, partial [Parasporobacterium sp.]|nr:hypothetical protein [Parasporobacterium sp.]
LMVQLHDTESDIVSVSDYLRQDNDKGVFFCEYGVFKQIYQLQIHRTSRLGYSSYLGMVTIVPETDTSKESPEYTAAVKSAASKLKKAMQVSLRSGDVITRYSETQFLILLPTCQYESTKIIVDRLRAKFYTGRSRYRVRLEFEFDEIV